MIVLDRLLDTMCMSVLKLIEKLCKLHGMYKGSTNKVCLKRLIWLQRFPTSICCNSVGEQFALFCFEK